VKRAILTVAALVACASLASTAGAQTPAQVAKYNRYLSRHPGVAQQLGAGGGMNNVLAGYAGNSATQNYANSYNAQYQKNLATYQNYLLTHPGVAQQMGAAGSPYGSYYPGAQYPDPTQQLTSNPLMATVAPLLGGYPGLQNYLGNYTGNVLPVAQPPYAGGAYPVGPRASYDDDEDFEGPHCHRGGGAGYGAYGAGPYGYGAAGRYGYGAGGPYQGAATAPYGHFRYGHGRYQGASTAFANGGGYFRRNAGLGQFNQRSWMGANRSSFGGGAGRGQAFAMRGAGGGSWMGHHDRHWGR
jgi:hypothetical protein